MEKDNKNQLISEKIDFLKDVFNISLPELEAVERAALDLYMRDYYEETVALSLDGDPTFSEVLTFIEQYTEKPYKSVMPDVTKRLVAHIKKLMEGWISACREETKIELKEDSKAARVASLFRRSDDGKVHVLFDELSADEKKEALAGVWALIVEHSKQKSKRVPIDEGHLLFTEHGETGEKEV